MKGSIRVVVAAGLVLVGSAVFAADRKGFQASFSPVAVGEEPTSAAVPEPAPPPNAAPVPVADAAPTALDPEEEALRKLTEEAAALDADAGFSAEELMAAEAAGTVTVTETPAEVPAPAAEPPSTAPETPAAETPSLFSDTTPAPEAPADMPTEPLADPEPVVDTAATEAPAEPIFIDPAVAAEEERLREEKRAARRAQQGPYIGFSSSSDHVGIVGVNDGRAPGLLAGYRYNQLIGIELAVARGEYDVPGSGIADCLLENATSALYVAVRSEESFYLKGRAGVLSESVESSGSCAPFSGNDVGASFSAGVGMRFGVAAMEVEYTVVEKEIYRVGWTFLLNF